MEDAHICTLLLNMPLAGIHGRPEDEFDVNLMTTMFMAMIRSKKHAEELSVSTVVKTLCTYSKFDLDTFLLEVF